MGQPALHDRSAVMDRYKFLRNDRQRKQGGVLPSYEGEAQTYGALQWDR